MIHAGCRGLYQPSALVRHWVPRERLEPRYFRRWLYQNGRDVAKPESVEYDTGTRMLLGVPRYLWRQAVSDVARASHALLAWNERARVAAAAPGLVRRLPA